MFKNEVVVVLMLFALEIVYVHKGKHIRELYKNRDVLTSRDFPEGSLAN